MPLLNEVKKIIETDVEQALSRLKQEMVSLRSSRPTPSLVEDITVEYYQNKMPLKQLGAIKIQLPNIIIIEPWDKASMSALVQAISASHLGLAPIVDGEIIRLSLPPMTQERRVQLVKLLHEYAEGARIKIRQGREKANKRIEGLFKEKQISEDDRFSFKDAVQKITDERMETIKNLVQQKEKELLQQ